MPEESVEWNEYRRLVLQTLKELKEADAAIEALARENKDDITILKTKMVMSASMAGILAGVASSVIGGLIIWFLTK